MNYYSALKRNELSSYANSVQSLSRVRLFATPWIAPRQASLSITNSRSSLRLMSIKSVMPSSHLILCHPLLLLPPIPPSIRVFSNESTLRIRWLKYWSFSFSIISSKEIPGMISFRMDWAMPNSNHTPPELVFSDKNSSTGPQCLIIMSELHHFGIHGLPDLAPTCNFNFQALHISLLSNTPSTSHHPLATFLLLKSLLCTFCFKWHSTHMK